MNDSKADETELPKIVTIKIDTTSLDEDTLEALRAIYIRDKARLPFKLPRLMSWPSKERANGERAMILLKNGYLELVEKSISNETKGTSSVNARVGADTKSDLASISKEPEARIRF
ncbi:MAG: hypothetical protein EOP04_04725 [Proteobacteria bacterium]|nr:MAG: hypothetical protein EOP04_04725 [Pseudomonadota bacterium]